ncbi:MAG: AAA family ATPase [Promethearchaeota archaeon]
MYLNKIKLENITSHKETEIIFERGLNVFTGLNGTGKSTVLKMVGYCLFPSKSFKQKDYVRKSSKNIKSGKVTLWIVGKDDQEFRIERSLGKSTLKVIDTKSGMQLTEIENQYDYINWVKEQMDIHPTTDLEILFQHAIGVEQGTFTAPFLETASIRKKIFSPLLNVDIYNVIWKKFREMEKVLEKKLKGLNDKILVYKTELRRRDEYTAERKRNIQQIDELKSSLKEFAAQYKEISKLYDSMKKLKDKIEKMEQGILKLKSDKEKYQQRIQILEQNSKDAEFAVQICKDNKEAFENYKILRKDEKNLITKESSLRALKTEVDSLNNKLIQIQTRQQEIHGRINEIEMLQPKYAEFKTKKAEYASLTADVEEMYKTIGKIAVVEEYSQLFQQYLTLIESEILEINPNTEKISDILLDINNFTVTQENIENLILQAKLGEWDKFKTRFNNEFTKLQQTLKEYKKYLEKMPDLIEKRNSMEYIVKEYNVLHDKFTNQLPTLTTREEIMYDNIANIHKKSYPLNQKLVELVAVEKSLNHVRNSLEKLTEPYQQYSQHYKGAAKAPKIKDQIASVKEELQNAEKKFKKTFDEYINEEAKFDEDRFAQLEQTKEKLSGEISSSKSNIKIFTDSITKFDSKLAKLDTLEQHLGEILLHHAKTTKHHEFTAQLRLWFKEAAPKITQAMLGSINSHASEIFRELIDIEGAELIWKEDYEIQINTANVTKYFHQLSGGEQMIAALAVRLAILRVQTKIDFAFFDEPTSNLDPDKRQNLSKQLQNIRGFNQLFVISHDDTFQTSGDYVVHFEKDEKNVSIVKYLQLEASQ